MFAKCLLRPLGMWHDHRPLKLPKPKISLELLRAFESNNIGARKNGEFTTTKVIDKLCASQNRETLLTRQH